MTARLLRFPSRLKPAASGGNPFDELADKLILAQAEAGTLAPGIVAALLAAVRQSVGEGDR